MGGESGLRKLEPLSHDLARSQIRNTCRYLSTSIRPCLTTNYVSISLAGVDLLGRHMIDCRESDSGARALPPIDIFRAFCPLGTHGYLFAVVRVNPESLTWNSISMHRSSMLKDLRLIAPIKCLFLDLVLKIASQCLKFSFSHCSECPGCTLRFKPPARRAFSEAAAQSRVQLSRRVRKATLNS